MLLMLAIVGSTPQNWLHHVFVEHADPDYGFREPGSAVAASGNHCGFDHQEAITPFAPAAPVIFCIAAIQVHQVISFFYYTPTLKGFHAHAGNRGPPAQQLPVL